VKPTVTPARLEQSNSPIVTRPALPEPYAVRTLQFVSPTSGPGFSVASSLSSVKEDRATRHRIEYMPWVRAFRVIYKTDESTVTAYIPEHRVSCWYPVE
jgi:hypothetical protein